MTEESSDHEYAYSDEDGEMDDQMMDLRPTRSTSKPTHYRGKSSGGNWGSQGSADYSLSGRYDESDDDGGGGPSYLNRMSSGKQPQAYRITSMMDLGERQAKLIAEVQELLGISPCPAKSLLRKYQWDVGRVCDQFEDATKYLEMLASPSSSGSKAASGKGKGGKGKGGGGKADTFICRVCFDTAPLSEAISLACNHHFCRDCVKTQFQVKIAEGESKRLLCLQGPECKETYPEEIVVSTVDAEAAQKYAKQNVEYFVKDNPRIKFCPGADCPYVVELLDGATGPVVVKCLCGHKRCFNCGDSPHFPLPCEYNKKWKERTADGGEMATIEFLKETVKICPWCKEGVYRYDGCNWMRCKCGGTWCYKCAGKVEKDASHTWNTIDKHECGRLQADPANESDTVRFMHYLQNFKSQRMLPEEEAKERGAEREELEDIQMVNKARRALANSYVFGYYGFVKESPFASRLSLFEDKQQLLEREVEVFARMLQDMHAAKLDKRPSEVDIKSQRDKVKHWLGALHGTIDHDILEDCAYGIAIPDFDMENI